MTEDMTEQQAEALVRQLAQGKESPITFFRDIVKAEDTTKTGNLTLEELGEPKLPVRSIKELELFSKDICTDEGWETYFKKLAEIQTSTSLSKDGLFIKLSDISFLSPPKILSSLWVLSKSNISFFSKNANNSFSL